MKEQVTQSFPSGSLQSNGKTRETNYFTDSIVNLIVLHAKKKNYIKC